MNVQMNVEQAERWLAGKAQTMDRTDPVWPVWALGWWLYQRGEYKACIRVMRVAQWMLGK